MIEFLAKYFSPIQLIGYLGMAFAILSYQFNKNKTYFILNTCCALSFTIQFALLGSWTGMFLNLFTIYRGIIMLIGDKCRKRGFLISVQALYLLSFILAVFVFKEAWYLAILPFIGAVGSTFVMWTRDGKKIRISQLFLLSPLWLIYDAINGSVGGVLCEIFNITSVIISFIRFRKAGYDKE